MEYWPTKIDWAVYEKKLAEGEFVPRDCIQPFRCDAPSYTGSLNAALSDFFPLLAPHLPQGVRDAMGPLVGAIATCGIKNWPQSNDGPKWLYDNSRDLSDAAVGQLYSPSTVSEIVRKFESVSRDELESALTNAWSLKSNDPADYDYSEVDYFTDANDFLEYLLGWFSVFQEAAADQHGIGIGGG